MITVQFRCKIDCIMIVSTVNWYRVLNQVFELIFSYLDNIIWKIIHVFYITNVLQWWIYDSPDNTMYCAGICMNFLLWKKNYSMLSSTSPYIAEKALWKFLINLINFWLISISRQWHSNCPEDSEISCADVANLAISLLLLGYFPKYLGYLFPWWGTLVQIRQIFIIFHIESSGPCCIL